MEKPVLQPKPRPEESRAPAARGAEVGRLTGTAYTPRPDFEKAASGRSRPSWPWVAVAVAVVAVGLGLWWYGSQANSSAGGRISPSAASTAQKVLPVTRADLNLKATEDAKALLLAWAQAARSDPRFDPVAAAAAMQAQRKAPSVATTLAKLTPEHRQEVARGERSFYKVLLYDNQQQDGDAVEVFLDGKSLGVLDLSNQGTDLTVPLKPGETKELCCLAVKDGGGGVTFGARSSTGDLRSRVMALGENETWGIAVQ